MLILLATYNGARYLPELLASIAGQTAGHWQLLIRDDGSTDATRDILAEAVRRDRRLMVLNDRQGRQGPSQNFGLLMQKAYELGARYVMLADQDDVWLPNKLEHSLRRMQQAEQASGPETPLLVHADLSVVDERLQMIHPSMTAYAGICRNPRDPLRTLLVYNFVTGCTALLNRPLLEAALPIPTAAVMHDWWLALCAAAVGRIGYLPEPVALYRQHADNTVGVHRFWDMVRPLSPYWQLRWKNAGAELTRSIRQAAALDRHLTSRAPHSAHQYQVVADYCHLFDRRRASLGRCVALWRLGIGPREVLRQLSLAARVFRLPPLAELELGLATEAKPTALAGSSTPRPHWNNLATRGERS